MIGVMSLLRDIARGEEIYSFVPDEIRRKCQAAVDRGIQCILKCQIRLDGRRAVWCAQHDRDTFEPRKARSYELASLSGSESVGIVRFLMKIEHPSDEVIRAIEDAVAWFERSELKGIKVVRVEDASTPRGYDRVVVEDPKAPPMWARFYDLETGRPIFCSRDGIPRRTLAEISYERRNGYSWLGHYAQGLLEKDYPAWKKRLGRN
jgi:PelA/Pel-15E family pectate lyase